MVAKPGKFRQYTNKSKLILSKYFAVLFIIKRTIL